MRKIQRFHGLLSLFLVIALYIGGIPISVSAEEKTKAIDSKTDSVSPATPTQLATSTQLTLFNSSVTNGFLAPIEAPIAGSIAISNRAELEAIRNNLSGNYHLTADIDLSGAEWVPIGNSSNQFGGIFDGQGYVIRNLVITGICENAGLFRSIRNATIKNIGLEGTGISANGDGTAGGAGGICYAAHDSSIINCYNTGAITISSKNDRAGGICGYAINSSIEDCYNTGNISVITSNNASAVVGGICGAGEGNQPIINCYNTGNIRVDSPAPVYAAGICGVPGPNGRVENCYNTGSVTAISSNNYIQAGGISARPTGSINNCYNTGDISASSTAILSHNATAAGICALQNGSINNCYNIGNISASSPNPGHTGVGAKTGGISGDGSAVVSNCYSTDLYGSSYGMLLTSVQMKDASNFIGFDFNNVWGIDPSQNGGYPYLKSLMSTYYNGGNNSNSELMIEKYSPQKRANKVPVDSQITMTFNKPIKWNPNFIKLREFGTDNTVAVNYGFTTVEADHQKSINLRPVEGLKLNTVYYVEIPSNVVHDNEATPNYFAGLKKGDYVFSTGDTGITFTTLNDIWIYKNETINLSSYAIQSNENFYIENCISSNSNIVSCTKSGIITGLQQGVATVTVTMNTGEILICSVYVRDINTGSSSNVTTGSSGQGSNVNSGGKSTIYQSTDQERASKNNPKESAIEKRITSILNNWNEIIKTEHSGKLPENVSYEKATGCAAFTRYVFHKLYNHFDNVTNDDNKVLSCTIYNTDSKYKALLDYIRNNAQIGDAIRIEGTIQKKDKDGNLYLPSHIFIFNKFEDDTIHLWEYNIKGFNEAIVNDYKNASTMISNIGINDSEVFTVKIISSTTPPILDDN